MEGLYGAGQRIAGVAMLVSQGSVSIQNLEMLAHKTVRPQ